MVTIKPKYPNATLVRRRDDALLLYAEGLFHSPADAASEYPEDWFVIPYKEARRLFGDMVPQTPGEWAAVPNIWAKE